jgi:phosphatidylserine/phosphatidylglycerophosphate/cardiolipin synthase-like enzyme
MGSLNMDPRSFYTNLESAVIVRNEPEFAAALVASIQKRIESLSQPLGDDGRFLDLPPSKNKIKMTIWQKMTDWILIRIRSIAEPFY